MLKFICDEGKINYMPDKITQAQVAANNWIKQEHTHRVVENGECTYETEIYSSLGCPTQCPVSDGRVCGAHGVCGWDTELKVARCMCNSGWGGLTGTECASTFAGPTTPYVFAFCIYAQDVCVILLLPMTLCCPPYDSNHSHFVTHTFYCSATTVLLSL